MTSDRTQRNIRRAAELIAQADALLITAGAGMSVDSGLPDFRGGQGFWRAYPPLEKLQISFEDMAQPHWFDSQPEMAWAFYGHRQRLYRETKPHGGYGCCATGRERCPRGISSSRPMWMEPSRRRDSLAIGFSSSTATFVATSARCRAAARSGPTIHRTCRSISRPFRPTARCHDVPIAARWRGRTC